MGKKYDIRDLREERRGYGVQYEQRHNIVVCEIVAVNDSVDVPKQPGYVWVLEYGRRGSPAPASNDRGVLAEAGTPVFVEKIPDKPEMQQRRIIGLYVDSLAPTDNTPVSHHSVPAHGGNHQWPTEGAPGPDAIRLYLAAWMPLKTSYATDLLEVEVQPLVYSVGGAYKLFSGQIVDLSSYEPATSGKLVRVLLYLDTTTNLITVLASSESTSPAQPAYPAVPSGGIPSAFLRIANGQTGFTYTDYTEARPPFSIPMPAPKKFYSGATDPGADDDESVGYELGSTGVNTTAGTFWALVDPSDGAAVWADLTGGGGGSADFDAIMTDADGQIMVDADGNVMIES